MENTCKHDQIQAIKKRLNDAVKRTNLNVHQLTDAINQKNDIEVNYNTIRNVLNYKCDALDLTTVIAISRYLHLDTAMLLSPPNTRDTTLQNAEDFMPSSKFVILDDSKYFGKFHCFFFSPNHKSSELIRFDLDIEDKDGSAKATMHYYGRPTSVYGERTIDSRVLYGIPYVDKLHSTIFITLTNDTGDFYFLYFNWQHFRSHDLYFRRGIALTASSLRDHPVLFMNFVLFARPVSSEKLPYISGLLADVSPTFSIPEDTVISLRNSEPLVNSFFEEFGYILEHNKKTMYTVNETQILSSSSDTMTEIDVIKALLLLKDASTASKRIVYEDIESFSSFSKNHLQQSAPSESQFQI